MGGTGTTDAGDRPGGRLRELGDYVLEEEIGRGGMGIVYRARQRSMGRNVALKVLPSFAGMDPAAVARFRREAEAAGRLSHPGIVPIYGVAELDGIHFFAMELVEGPTLATLVDALGVRSPGKLRDSLIEEAQQGERFPSLKDVPGSKRVGNDYLRSCVALLADVANALSAAHAERIVHRDIKPSNILIHATGRPVVVDFGLARDEQSLALTRSGEQIGTPSYMAPEQASGRRAVDARVDIYGLGAVLYELLTLRPPFSGGTAAEITRRILEEPPAPVRKRNPEIPADLATIVDTCLAKDPDDRYPAAEALELDLRAFVAGRPISARPLGTLRRLAAFARKHRTASVVAAGAAVITAAIAISAGVVGERKSQTRGLEMLQEARTELVQFGNAARARSLYERARALLPDQGEVARARVSDLRDAFDKHYPERLADLRGFAATIPEEYRPEIGDLLERLDGRGWIELAREVDSSRVDGMAIRPFGSSGVADQWEPVVPRQPLPLGEYLVRIESAGAPPVVQWLRIVRDAASTLLPRFATPRQLPPGSVQVVDPVDSLSFVVSRTELSRREYRFLLSQLSDSDLVAELPAIDEADPDLPLHGLSFRHARSIAAHLGGHLPSERELWLAASGGLKGLPYPWGMKFDADRLIADPDHRSRPESVESMAAGASPLGVLHSFGNVAEILSPDFSSSFRMAGGHFHTDDPTRLRMSRQAMPTTPLAGPDAKSRYAGMRLLFFVPPEDDASALDSAEKARQKILEAGSGLVHDWRVVADGSVHYELMMHGLYDGRTDRRSVDLVTSGFLQDPRDWVLRDGHGRELQSELELREDGEISRFDVSPPDNLRIGQRYRVGIEAALVPASGLYGEGDGYVMRMPVKAAAQPVLYRLRLPRSARVSSVEPRPSFQFHAGGVPHLIWSFEPTDDVAGRTLPVTVRFRIDGMLTSRWSAVGPIAETVQEFFSRLNRRSTDLSGILDPRFLQKPNGYPFSYFDGPAASEDTDQFDAIEIQDVTTVADVVTVDLHADWRTRDRSGRDIVMRDWPMLLQACRHGNEFRVLRLMPKSRADTGRLDQGVYRHERLKMSLRAQAEGREDEAVLIQRTQDELVELQVAVRMPGRSDLMLQVVGLYADGEETELQNRFLLTSGAIVMRPGARLSGGAESEVVEWMFSGSGTSSWARERWRFVTRGRRHFLIKRIVLAESAMDADRKFATPAVRAWFERVIERLELE